MIRSILLPLLALAVGCSASVNVKRMTPVKRVAVIGFSLEKEEPQAEGMAALVNLAQKAASGDFFGSAQAAWGYELVRQRLGDGTGWTIIPMAEVAASPIYQKLAKEKEGTISALNKLGGLASPDGVMDHFTALDLDTDERRMLMKELKVDALMSLGTRIRELNTVSIGPLSVRRYRSTARVQVHDGVDKELIWEDGGAIGESSGDVVSYDLGNLGELGEDPEPMLMKALELSCVELIKRYRDAMKGK